MSDHDHGEDLSDDEDDHWSDEEDDDDDILSDDDEVSADDESEEDPARKDYIDKDLPPAVADSATEFRNEIYAEIRDIQERLNASIQTSSKAFLDMCNAPARTRTEYLEYARKCTGQNYQLVLHMKLILEKYERITGVKPDRNSFFDATALWWQPATPEMQPFVDRIKDQMNKELAKFEKHLDDKRAQFKQHVFELCNAGAKTRGQILLKAAECNRQVQLLEVQMDRIARVLFTGGDRQPFVHVEDRYPLKLYTNEYPYAMSNSYVLPLLAALIAEDEKLSAAACVPLGPGPAVGNINSRVARAMSRGKPRLLEQEAGNLKFYSSKKIKKLKKQRPFLKALHAHNEEDDLYYFLSMERDAISAEIAKCASHRFILLLLSGLQHQNALLIDTLAHTIERIEPHGFDGYKMEDFTAVTKLFVEKTLNKLGLGKFTYVSPYFSCPRHGPQSRQAKSQHGGGYCVAWSAFILLSRILNPEYTTEEVQNHIMLGRSPKYLKDLIRAFIAFAETKLENGDFHVAEERVRAAKEDFPLNRSASPDAPFRAY